MRISDWSSDVCSSDLVKAAAAADRSLAQARPAGEEEKDDQHREKELDRRRRGRRDEIVDDRCRRGSRHRLFGGRKSGVEGKSVSVRVDLGGRRIIKKKHNIQSTK